MAEVVLVDTGPLVALADRGEEFHKWAGAQLRQIYRPMVTCGAVLAEAGFVVRHHPTALARTRDLLERGDIISAEESQELWLRAWGLMERYANVPMSFADACLVALAESIPGARLFTLDRDFLIYRQQNDQPLTLLAPFAG
ncbi:MAG TPA: PIN domain-containing protein [Verrucomicrobiae bacterium]|nr:PIN domain-containing protein [Verrucomicrobiae bacterium]